MLIICHLVNKDIIVIKIPLFNARSMVLSLSITPVFVAMSALLIPWKSQEYRRWQLKCKPMLGFTTAWIGVHMIPCQTKNRTRPIPSSQSIKGSRTLYQYKVYDNKVYVNFYFIK